MIVTIGGYDGPIGPIRCSAMATTAPGGNSRLLTARDGAAVNGRQPPPGSGLPTLRLATTSIR